MKLCDENCFNCPRFDYDCMGSDKINEWILGKANDAKETKETIE